MQRYGSVINLKADEVLKYEELHANVWPKVLEKITECHLRNYSIFRYGLLLFSYFEYVGDDFEADMAKMAEDETTQKWWEVCKPLQQPVAEATDHEWWHDLSEIFHHD